MQNMKKKRRWLAVLLLLLLGTGQTGLARHPYAKKAVVQTVTQNTEETAAAPDMGLTAVSSVLMEASTGTVLYEKNADQRLSPASITKIMTIVLIFDALEQGKITLTDRVTTSAYAASMGGSQVFLEEGEVQDVETLIKCIVVASGNDASVAMAEYLSGSETAFVEKMNERAAELGMENTHFEDCCGLTDSDGHYTSARDVAIMSRELTVHYPQIHTYSTIWMDTITHETARGSSEFGLANTNKLLKQYSYATGLKTGSTSKAKYCVSATAEKDGVELIAVVLAAADYKVRFQEAKQLLEYGFANCSLYEDEDAKREPLPLLPVTAGKKEQVELRYAEPFSWLATGEQNPEQVERRLVLPEEIEAPLAEGDTVGTLEYWYGEQIIGSVPVQAAEAVERVGYGQYLQQIFLLYCPE